MSVEIVGPGQGSGSLVHYEPPRWGVDQLVASWLAQFESAATRESYRGDMRQYLGWCGSAGLDPLNVGLPEIQVFGEHLRRSGSGRGRQYAARTITRKINAVSSFYLYCSRAGALPYNPARDARRPSYDRSYSPTHGISNEQARAMLAAAVTLRQRVMPPRALHLAMCLMVDLGARVSEVCGLDWSALGREDGVRTVTLHAKGSKKRVRPIPAQLGPVVDAWRVQCPPDAGAAMLVDKRHRRITRNQIYQLIKRLAREAGIPDADEITPHSCRHAFKRIGEERGADLESLRAALGHASLTTTQLYGQQRRDLATDPAHLVSASTWTPMDTDENEQGEEP